jgi:uracil-DNA glycosylase
MRTVEALLADVEREARRAPFPIDEPAYQRVGKDPLRPILLAGSLEAPICSVGRDLGKDEVAAGEPQIGAAGRLVRAGVYRAVKGTDPPTSDRGLETALAYVLLTNLVPYKPPGNKAYSASIRERFRPFLAELLAVHWKGTKVLSLGTEAFRWFEPYTERGAADAFWAREDRYEAELPCELVVETDRGPIRKAITLAPLPHPSPLNQRWYARFPELLARRLEGL